MLPPTHLCLPRLSCHTNVPGVAVIHKKTDASYR